MSEWSLQFLTLNFVWAGVDVITLEGHILHEIIPQEKILKIKIYIIFVGQLPITADVIQSEQQIKDKETSHTTEKSQLKWKSPPKLHQLLTVSEIEGCNHISFVTSNCFWISDYKNSLILTNTTGETLYHLDNLYCGELYVDSLYSDSFHFIGSHTVNNESELFYIDKDYSINKLSKDMRTTFTFLEYTKSTWRPRCLCWSRPVEIYWSE